MISLRAQFEDGSVVDAEGCNFDVAVVMLRTALAAVAQGTEARRAETVKHGSVHDGPVRASECAQDASPTQVTPSSNGETKP
jgi:hypothetical protein